MKTKLILNSGGVKRREDLKKQFHQEMVKGLPLKLNILICSFAQGREFWEEKFPGYSASIKEDLPEHDLSFTLAMPDDFANQIKDADIIYFNGGDDHLFAYWMDKFEFRLFEGKVLATNSASSDYLSDSFWPNDWKKPMMGRGVLPIKFIPHYEADETIDWLKVEEELRGFGDPELPIYKLKEGEFVVFEVDGKGSSKEIKVVT